MKATRSTRQKRIIRECFQTLARPLSYAELVQLTESVSISTIYRVVTQLVQDGWLAEVQLPGQPHRFEICGKGHHHHFSCEICERVYDLPGDCLLKADPELPPGFRASRHEYVLYGACPECQASNTGRPVPSPL